MTRKDKAWYARFIAEAMAYKFVIALLAILLVISGLLNVVLTTKQRVVIIDSSSGKSYWGGQASNTNEIWENQVIYHSKHFIELLHSADASFVEKSREEAVEYMVQVLREENRETVLDPKKIENIIRSRAQSDISFVLEPQILEYKYPAARTYAHFKREIRLPDGQINVIQKHIVLDWHFYNSTPERPSGLWLSSFHYIDESDRTKLNEILNQVKER